MEAIDTPMNYKGDGTWFFSAQLSSGYYELDVTPHLFLYNMLLPDGKRIEGTIPTLLTKIENYHQDPELSEWLKNALSWDDRRTNFKNWEKTVKFDVEGKSYKLCCNPRTGGVELMFKEAVYVSKRSDLGTIYPEIYGIKQGELSELITAVVADAMKEIDPDEYIFNLPDRTDKIEHYEISGLELWISYNAVTDFIVIHLEPRIERTHISTIESDVSEFGLLHNGKYREEVIGILADNGFMDAEL